MWKRISKRTRYLCLVLAVFSLCLAVLVSFYGAMPTAVYAAGAGESIPEPEEPGTGEEAGEPTEDKDGGSVSDNDAVPEKCSCKEKCNFFVWDNTCPVCKGSYEACGYEEPNVTIAITPPKGWYNRRAVVKLTAKDASHTGNFTLVKMEAKIGQQGSWVDVTEEKEIEISENCTVYVKVTDQKGNEYEKNKAIACFDRTKPSINAAVSEGLLSIQVEDTDSGAKAVYVNGYTFTSLTNGTVNIRLEQFDAGYEYFSISAMDYAGNMSEIYKTKNPYYKSLEDDGEEEPVKQLPASAEATKPSSATAVVTEHTKTETAKPVTTGDSAEDKKKAELAKADAAEQTAEESGEKEFYTIEAASGKVFYLIIDRSGEEELVYFLTEITENDLLNVTSDNSEVLPKNSAALDSGIVPEELKEEEVTEEEVTEPVEAEEPEAVKDDSLGFYLLLGGVSAAVIGGAYYFKFVRKKDEDFIEDEDEEEPEEEEYPEEETEEEEKDFFDRQEDRE